MVRADPGVVGVGVELDSGARLELPLVATLPEPALNFFAALLPRTVAIVSFTAMGAHGQTLEPPT